MGKDTPSYEPSAKERGLHARENTDPTLASYLSSLLYLLAVPGFILLAYGGYWTGIWDYGSIVPVFAGLLITTVVTVFAIMHVFTGR